MEEKKVKKPRKTKQSIEAIVDEAKAYAAENDIQIPESIELKVDKTAIAIKFLESQEYDKNKDEYKINDEEIPAEITKDDVVAVISNLRKHNCSCGKCCGNCHKNPEPTKIKWYKRIWNVIKKIIYG